MSCRLREKKGRRSTKKRELARDLYEWRRKNDLSQGEAGLALNISVRTLQEWEQSRAQPRGFALAALRKLIGG